MLGCHSNVCDNGDVVPLLGQDGGNVSLSFPLNAKRYPLLLFLLCTILASAKSCIIPMSARCISRLPWASSYTLAGVVKCLRAILM